MLACYYNAKSTVSMPLVLFLCMKLDKKKKTQKLFGRKKKVAIDKLKK